MLSEKLQDELNRQMNAELYSSYLYLSMSAYFHHINLDGFANWMYIQAQEEALHAKKIYDFIVQRGGRVLLERIDAPPAEWASAEAVFKDTFAHEQKVTASINHLVDLAIEEHDHATHIFLQWFVTEQVEEEQSADGILQKVRRLAKDPHGLMLLDRDLAQRSPVITLPQGEA